jgi:O-antigen ligase
MTFIVQAIRSYFSDKVNLSSVDISRAVVLAFTVSIFAPFYFSLVVICLIALMTMIHYRIREKAFSAPYTRLIFSFIAVSFFVAAICNNYRGMAYSIMIYAVFTCGLYLRSVMTRQLFHQAMDTACVGSVWCALIAIGQKFAALSTAPDYRPVSVFSNANYYGMIIEFIVLIALYRIFTNPDKAAFYAVVLSLNFIGLYLTASYSSLFATLCSVLVIVLYKKNHKLTACFFGGVLSLAAVSLVFPTFLPRGPEALERTISQRLSIWDASFKGIQQSPLFGHGAMAYQMICDQFGGYHTYHCHNLILDILLNFGIFGLVVLTIYFSVNLRLLTLRFRNNVGGDMNILLMAAFTAVLVHGLTDVTIFWIQTAALFFLMVSSIGIGSAYLEEDIALPKLFTEYYDDHSAQVAYLRD